MNITRITYIVPTGEIRTRLTAEQIISVERITEAQLTPAEQSMLQTIPDDDPDDGEHGYEYRPGIGWYDGDMLVMEDTGHFDPETGAFYD